MTRDDVDKFLNEEGMEMSEGAMNELLKITYSQHMVVSELSRALIEQVERDYNKLYKDD